MGRILDLFINKYNYTDFHELNLDWIISDLRTLADTLENFINLNTIKYANPIQWDITSQYEANTVVIDASNGTAYLSVQPVPSGVAITNTDYWMPIFTLNLLSANHNITLHDDSNNRTATQNWTVGQWLLLNDNLYIVTRDIAEGNAYVFTGDNANVRAITVESEEERIYYPNDKKLSIHSKISDYAQITTLGDVHTYNPTTSAITIEHLDE